MSCHYHRSDVLFAGLRSDVAWSWSCSSTRLRMSQVIETCPRLETCPLRLAQVSECRDWPLNLYCKVSWWLFLRCRAVVDDVGDHAMPEHSVREALSCVGLTLSFHYSHKPSRCFGLQAQGLLYFTTLKRKSFIIYWCNYYECYRRQLIDWLIDWLIDERMNFNVA